MDATSSPIRITNPRRRWLIGAVIVFFLALSAQYTGKVLDQERENRSAFLRWRGQILELYDGVNIWDKHDYPNPPVMVMLLLPLALLPPLVGALAWFYLKALMALTAIYLVFRLIETPDRPWSFWAKCAAVALTLRPIMGDLSHGNINLFIMLLCVVSLTLFQKRHEAKAGLFLALGIACKVTPALFVPYFVWKRAWTLLGGCAVGMVLFLWLVPGLFFGFQENKTYLTTWYREMIEPYALKGVVTTDHENQSLPGVAHRLLTQSPSFSIFVDEVYVPTEYHNFVALDPAVAHIIVKVCMGLFALIFVWVCRTPTDKRQRWQLAAEYSLVLLGMLLFSERTWKHHCVTMLLPFSVLCYYVATCHPTPGLKRYLMGSLVAAGLLMAATSTGWSTTFERFGKLAQVYGAYVWANLILVAALVVVLRHAAFLDYLRSPRSRLSPENAEKHREKAGLSLIVGHPSRVALDQSLSNSNRSDSGRSPNTR